MVHSLVRLEEKQESVWSWRPQGESIPRRKLLVISVKLQRDESPEASLSLSLSLYDRTCGIWELQVRGLTRAATVGLCHSQGNTRSKPHLWPTLQLVITPDPWPTDWGQGSNMYPRRDNTRSLTHWATMRTPRILCFDFRGSLAASVRTVSSVQGGCFWVSGPARTADFPF